MCLFVFFLFFPVFVSSFLQINSSFEKSFFSAQYSWKEWFSKHFCFILFKNKKLCPFVHLFIKSCREESVVFKATQLVWYSEMEYRFEN